MQSIADVYRPAALFATNRENFVAENGDFAGTQINSSNMLWSLSGNISLVHKVLFGIELKDDELSFHPFVPEALKGARTLNNFKYRNAILNIRMQGFGNEIASLKMDGKVLSAHTLSSNIKGAHSIEIILSNKIIKSDLNEQPVYFSPATPEVSFAGSILKWERVKDATNYIVLKNGKEISSIQTHSFNIEKNSVAEYQIIAVDKNKVQSFASEPLLVADHKHVSTYQSEQFAAKSDSSFKGFTGDGFVEIGTTVNRKLSFNINVRQDGLYAIDFHYANGNGPTNTENKCALRTLNVDDKKIGTVVFPQRGKNEWSNWGFSNATKVYLIKGNHVIGLSFEEFDNNMNEEVNQAMIDEMKLVKLKQISN